MLVSDVHRDDPGSPVYLPEQEWSPRVRTSRRRPGQTRVGAIVETGGLADLAQSEHRGRALSQRRLYF